MINKIVIKNQQELDLIPEHCDILITIDFGTESAPAIIKSNHKYVVWDKKEKFLFDNGRGSVYRSNSVQIKQICKKANIRERRFHDLRHTHAATLLMNGVHPKIVQERLGHSQMEFTLRVYSQFLPTIQEAAVKVYQDIPSCSTISLATSRVI